MIDSPTTTQLATMLLLGAAVGLIASIAFVGIGAGADNSTLEPYYENESTPTVNDSWFGGGNATLDQMVGMVAKLPRYVIGSGDVDPSGTGYVGVLLTGIIMAGAALSAVAGAGVGPIGGTVVAIATGWGLTSVGFAPDWIRVLLLFGIGLLAAIAARRAIES